MNNINVWLIIISISLLLGSLHYGAGYFNDIEKKNWMFKLMEYWRIFSNYFITTVIAYYLISLRLDYFIKGDLPSASDFILGSVFLMGIFGWIPYFVKNLTEGISVIFKKYFEK